MDSSLPGSLCPWDPRGKITGVRCHALLQGIFPIQGLNPGLLHCSWILSQQGSQVPEGGEERTCEDSLGGDVHVLTWEWRCLYNAVITGNSTDVYSGKWWLRPYVHFSNTLNVYKRTKALLQQNCPGVVCATCWLPALGLCMCGSFPGTTAPSSDPQTPSCPSRPHTWLQGPYPRHAHSAPLFLSPHSLPSLTLQALVVPLLGCEVAP